MCSMQPNSPRKLEKSKSLEEKYPYCVSWYHVSSKEYHYGDKAKMKTFMTEKEANKFYLRLVERQKTDTPFEQGFISHLHTNFETT